MTNWKDIRKNDGNGQYEDAEFIEVKELLGRDVEITSVTPFENEKGPGIIALVYPDRGETPRKLVTHSLGITKVLGSEEFMTALRDLPSITINIKEGKSKKSGKYFYYVD